MPSGLASRSHVIIDYSRGKFIVVDNSTNGTYLKPANEKQVYLRREEIPLIDRGQMGLGDEVSEGNQHLIAFKES